VSDNNWIPSSTGESLAGEDDKTRNKFITKGTKDERRWGDSMKEESKDQTPQRLIPGACQFSVLFMNPTKNG